MQPIVRTVSLTLQLEINEINTGPGLCIHDEKIVRVQITNFE